MNHLCKILLVDDEYLLRQGLKYLCSWEEEGFTIIGEASNGVEALELTKKLQPHIVITDIVMPLLDGVELIKEIKSYDAHIQIVVLSSHENFDYVKESFKFGVKDYILKPKLSPDELLPLLRNMRTSLSLESPNSNSPTVSISHILAASLSGFQNPQDYLHQLKIHFPYDAFILVTTDFSHYCQDIQALGFIKETIIAPYITQYLSSFHTSDFTLSPSTYALLINGASIDLNKIISQIEALTTVLNTHIPRTQFALSQSFTSLNELKAIYHTNKQLLTYSFFFEELVILQVHLIPKKQNAVIFDFNAFYHFWDCLDSSMVKDSLSSYIKEVAENLSSDVITLKKFIENIIYSSIHYIEKMGFDISSFTLLKITCLKDIENTKYIQELLHVVTKTINEIFIELATQSDHSQHYITEKVIGYIKENYGEQISLATVAENLHLNYSYLSSCFNNHAKESFTDCLNKIRISKAKELLLNVDLSISEISGAVGYTDQSYFGKVFKKLTGFTPSTYRRHHLYS